MKGVYPIVITQDDNCFLVYIPDFDINTESDSLEGAIEMARDAIGLMGITFEDDGKEIPKPNLQLDCYTDTKEGEISSLVDVDFDEYRKKHDNRLVKKNCTIPYYLAAQAEKENINFSALLKEALLKRLNIAQNA